jgi:aspartate aminotransferase
MMTNTTAECFISEKAKKIEPSMTIAITALAKKMKAEGHDVLSFSAGEPDFKTPDAIAKAGIDAITNGKTTYTASAGTPEIRKAIAQKIQRELGLTYAIDEIIDQVSLADGKSVIIETTENTEFKLTPALLKQALTPKSKVLIINSPSNPTGSVYSKAELEALVPIIIENNLVVISDEIYAKLIYGSQPFTSIATLPGMKERTLLVDGASKAYAMTGWRIGYTAGPKSIITAMDNIQSHATSNPTTPSQWAATTAFLGDDSEIEKMKLAFDERRKYMVKTLNSIPGITCLEPLGAFYAFPNVSKLFGKKSAAGPINNSFDVCERLLQEAKVACVPGSAFGAEGFLRLSYATSMEEIKAGLERIAKWASELN